MPPIYGNFSRLHSKLFSLGRKIMKVGLKKTEVKCSFQSLTSHVKHD